jgi:hypothetical protein
MTMGVMAGRLAGLKPPLRDPDPGIVDMERGGAAGMFLGGHKTASVWMFDG